MLLALTIALTYFVRKVMFVFYYFEFLTTEASRTLS